MMDMNSGSSSSTNFEMFMSLNTLITILVSDDLGLALLVIPSVFNTDKIFLRPKS